MALEKLDPERREARRQKREDKKGYKRVPAPKPNHRHIPNPLRDKIWLRDKGECQFQNKKSGKLCGSKYLIQADHRYPYALGGEHSEKNLQLRCRQHNLYQTGEVL